MAQLYPDTTLHEYSIFFLESCNMNVSKHYIARFFRSIRWSWKKPYRKSLRKYSNLNISYYHNFVSWISNLTSWQNIKFMDESTFNPRDLRRVRAISPIGQQINLVNTPIKEKKINLMAMIQIDNPVIPIVTQIIEGNSNSEKFLNFIRYCCAEEYLKSGDILVLDNARYHKAKIILDDLQDLCEEFNFSVKFLPAYSPELNPIEFVFGFMKNTLRAKMQEDVPFSVSFLATLLLLDTPTIFTLYYHCWRKPFSLSSSDN